MKSVITKNSASLLAVLAATILLSGCGTTAEDILKKYEAYGQIEAEANKAGISIELQETGDVLVTYACPLLNASEENVQKLSTRWFVANAEKPEVKLPVEAVVKAIVVDSVENSSENATETYSLILQTGAVESRFLIIGFEGIAPTESTEADTPPLFFLIENNREEHILLTPSPKVMGELFTADYTPTFFSEQEYVGEIPFDKSKNVVLSLTLSPDLKQITKLTLTAKSMTLTPRNFDKSNKNPKEEDLFKYLKNSTRTISFNFQSGVGSTLSASNITHLQLSGGLESTRPIDIAEGKIISDQRPIIADATIINACIYGTLHVELESCGTSSAYAVLKNTTTPQEIPDGILKETTQPE
jgi:hypothetical protein